MQKRITLTDRIYGRHVIDSPVAVELINSAPFQRLKYISQLGVPQKYYYREGFSRYEHSLGVFLLLRSLGATLDEQVAGLLHDISHTTFSHVVDWMIENHGKDDYHESRFWETISSPNIANILTRYGLDPFIFADLDKFGLLDRHIPQLGADRLDYSFRQFPQSTVKICFKDLTVVDKQVVFKSKKGASLFGRNYLDLQMTNWSGFENMSRYQIFSQVLKRAVETKIISNSDFYSEDERYILKRIEASHDKYILSRLQLLKRKKLSDLPASGKVVTNKFRYVNPPYLYQGKLVLLSETDSHYKSLIEKARALNAKGVCLPNISNLG